MSEKGPYEEAVNSGDKERWIEAIKEELNSLANKGTWELVDLPPGK